MDHFLNADSALSIAAFVFSSSARYSLPNSDPSMGDRQSYMEKMDTLVALAEESTGGVTNPREASSAQLREMFEKVI